MSIKHIIWIVGGIITVTILGALMYVFLFASPAPEPSPSGTVTLPGSGPAPLASSTPSGGQAMIITNQDGKEVVVNDFLHNGTTIPDTVNPGRYLLAGNLGYCPSSSQECQTTSSGNFNAYYESGTQSFVISLTDEPIGHARLVAEQFLLKTLGISDLEMCTLKYYVGATTYVNEQYGGKNLGFSFCPGATKLPQ